MIKHTVNCLKCGQEYEIDLEKQHYPMPSELEYCPKCAPAPPRLVKERPIIFNTEMVKRSEAER